MRCLVQSCDATDCAQYDAKACHEAIAQSGAQAVIHPHKYSKAWKDKSGCAGEKPSCCACKRLGKRVMARTFERQVPELHIRVALLNHFTQRGHHVTVPVAQLSLGSGETGLPSGSHNNADLMDTVTAVHHHCEPVTGRPVPALRLTSWVLPRTINPKKAAGGLADNSVPDPATL